MSSLLLKPSNECVETQRGHMVSVGEYESEIEPRTSDWQFSSLIIG